jgi:hypothetical protein
MNREQATALAAEARHKVARVLGPTNEGWEASRGRLEQERARMQAARETAESMVAERLPAPRPLGGAGAPVDLAAARAQVQSVQFAQVRPFAKGHTARPAQPEAAGEASREVPDWHLSRGGQTYGPYTWAQLRELARQGQVAPTDLVWTSGWPEWVPAARGPGPLAPLAGP